MEIGLVRKVDIETEMQQSYMDYAMSVIVSRALPDARDGLKPVQRRILYAMYDMGLRPNTSHKKSARIVGEVLGKYHPHGDMAVYEAMARLAQDFTVRYPLVDGQGNFGSIDGDPPAAMRYTEARLLPFAVEILKQIEKNTVDYVVNFDDTLKEPDVLPAAIPNLLVNGSNGIAVGMSTNIPPHNLGEVIDACVYMLKAWDKLDDIDISDLMNFIKGPDFPTGGIVLEGGEQSELLSAYASGRGRIKVRGRVHVEEMARGRSRIIITELPFQTNKTNLIEKIADLARNEVLEGVTDLRDESDRQGMRIVLELSKSSDTDTILRKLYRSTPLESTYGLALLALVKNEPRLLTLKQALHVYLEHRIEIIKRRSEFDLAKAEQRAHILEGLRVALKNLDQIIALIRKAPDVDTAKSRIMRKYKLSDVQAQAILDMQLRKLASLERKKIDLEYKELQKIITELKALLKSATKMRLEVEKELLEMKNLYGDNRRTQIVSLKEGESTYELLTATDVTPELKIWVGASQDGYVGRTKEDKLSRISGKNAPGWVLRATTHQTLYMVTESGQVAAVGMQALPEVDDFSEGGYYSKIAPLDENEKLSALFTVPMDLDPEAEYFVVTVTKGGMVKKSSLFDLPGPSAHAFTLAKVNEGDSLKWVFITDGRSEIFLSTENGMAIRFSENDVRPMGLVAIGVNGIKLKGKDSVAFACRLDPKDEVILLGSDGQGWRLPEKSFPLQGRYGQGVIVSRMPAKVKIVGGASGKRTQIGLLHFKNMAAKKFRIDQIELGQRLRAGKEVIQIKEKDYLENVTKLEDESSFWNQSKKK